MAFRALRNNIERWYNPSLDPRINDLNEKIFVIFEGSISLWRTKTNLDLIIVYHELYSCLELVAYEPISEQEAPRVYIDVPVLISHLNPDELDQCLEGKKDSYIKKQRVFDFNQILREAYYELSSKYVESRISVDTAAQAKGMFKIYLKSKPGDSVIKPKQGNLDDNLVFAGKAPDGSHIDVVMNCPVGLLPLNTLRYDPKLLNADQEENMRRNKVETAKKSEVISVLQEISAVANALDFGFDSRSMAKRRWKRAVRRVINQIRCGHIRKKLAYMAMIDAAKHQPSSLLGPKPMKSRLRFLADNLIDDLIPKRRDSISSNTSNNANKQRRNSLISTPSQPATCKPSSSHFWKLAPLSLRFDLAPDGTVAQSPSHIDHQSSVKFLSRPSFKSLHITGEDTPSDKLDRQISLKTVNKKDEGFIDRMHEQIPTLQTNTSSNVVIQKQSEIVLSRAQSKLIEVKTSRTVAVRQKSPEQRIFLQLPRNPRDDYRPRSSKNKHQYGKETPNHYHGNANIKSYSIHQASRPRSAYSRQNLSNRPLSPNRSRSPSRPRSPDAVQFDSVPRSSSRSPTQKHRHRHRRSSNLKCYNSDYSQAVQYLLNVDKRFTEISEQHNR